MNHIGIKVYVKNVKKNHLIDASVETESGVHLSFTTSSIVTNCNLQNLIKSFAISSPTNARSTFGLLHCVNALDAKAHFLGSALGVVPLYGVLKTLSLDKVREFVAQLGSELLAMFDFEWSKGDEEKIMKLYKEQQPAFAKKLIINSSTISKCRCWYILISIFHFKIGNYISK